MLAIFLQDLKHRAIHFGLIILLLIISFLFWFVSSKSTNLLAMNFIFIVTTFSILFLYSRLRKIKSEQGVYFGLGLGDILFFIVVIPLFSIHNYIFFFISGLFFSLLIHLLFANKKKSKLIPLAGYLGIYTLLLKVYTIFTNINFYNDFFNI